MKMTGSRKLIGGTILAGVMTLTGIVGFAQEKQQLGTNRSANQAGREWKHGPGRERGDFFGRFWQNLNLTDAQKEQMRQIASRYHENAKAQRQQMPAERGNEFNIFNGGVFDENAVRAAAQARANARVEMEVSRARMMYEMYNVLTPEQKSQLAADRQQRAQKRAEWRAKRQANSGQSQ